MFRRLIFKFPVGEKLYVFVLQDSVMMYDYTDVCPIGAKVSYYAKVNFIPTIVSTMADSRNLIIWAVYNTEDQIFRSPSP